MKEPNFRIKELVRLNNICNKLSTYNEKPSSTTIRTYNSEELFNKLCLHIDSSCVLINSFKEKEVIDSTVLASVARIVIEIHHALYYLTEKKLSNAELDFRLDLMSYHAAKNKVEINKLLHVEHEKGRLDDFIIKTKKSAIGENTFFKSLSDPDKKICLKGKKAFFTKTKKRYSPIEDKLEKGIYKLLSNSIHSFPLGIRNSKFWSSGVAGLGSMGLLFLSVEVITTYTASIIKRYLALRWKLGQSLSKEEKMFIRETIENCQLSYWQRYSRWKSETELF